MGEPERSHGWTLLATILVGVAGAWNLLLGVAAFAKEEYFEQNELLYANIGFWGVVWLCIGALQVLTSVLIARRTLAGKALGIAGATASLFVWFFSIDAHPIASVLVIVMDILILYALTADRPYTGSVGTGQRSDLSLEATRHFT
jgi:hypothetical protein